MRITMWLMLVALIGTTSKTANAPLTITLSSIPSMVPYGAQIGYDIQIVNHTDHKVECDYNFDPFGFGKGPYFFEITNMSGKRIFHEHVNQWMGSEHACIIDPGAAKSWGAAVLPRDYPGLVPGEYRIRVSAQNPDNPSGKRIYSNSVTFKIQPPPAPPPN